MVEAIRDVQEKAWGTTETLIETPVYSLHRLEIVKGGFCSIHFHERKNQQIVVLKGKLEMRVFDQVGNMTCKMHITPGECVISPFGLRHQFLAREPSVVLESYTPVGIGGTVDPNDIVRLSDGGVLSL